MADSKRKKGLGRGLSTLLEDIGASAEAANAPASTVASAENERGVRSVPIEAVYPNPDQPRTIFKPAEMDDLTRSIEEKGILQPLLVREDPSDQSKWMIVAGERRWRAAQAAQLHQVPILVKTLSEEEILEIAIIENVQRADLNALEEARGYQQLIDKFGRSQAELAKGIGKSRPYIANALRLLKLPEKVQDLVSTGRLSAGHARALITSGDPERLANDVLAKGLSVRQTEELAKQLATPRAKQTRVPAKDADTRALEADLSAALGVKVVISHKGAAGDLTIHYKDLEQLDGLCQLLMKP